jgi:hypothetical protein
MTVHMPDSFKAASAFWMGLAKIGPVQPGVNMTMNQAICGVFSASKRVMNE